jgi:hypothetical protein
VIENQSNDFFQLKHDHNKLQVRCSQLESSMTLNNDLDKSSSLDKAGGEKVKQMELEIATLSNKLKEKNDLIVVS